MRLKDRVAVVTGGGGGIGEGICLCLAREGAHIVVSDQNRPSAEKVAERYRNWAGRLWPFRPMYAEQKTAKI